MTQKLGMLKGVLQKVLGESVENEEWQDAVSAAIYSCDFETTTALKQWMDIWTLTDSHILTETEIEYQRGVQFVADEWDKILSEGKL